MFWRTVGWLVAGVLIVGILLIVGGFIYLTSGEGGAFSDGTVHIPDEVLDHIQVGMTWPKVQALIGGERRNSTRFQSWLIWSNGWFQSWLEIEWLMAEDVNDHTVWKVWTVLRTI